MPHPVSEHTARCFHCACIVVGVLHIVAGLVRKRRSEAAAHLVIGTLMVAFHGVSQRNHGRGRRVSDYGYGNDWIGVG